MIIANLSHLEEASEVSSIVGGGQLRWVPASNGVVPPGAVRGGFEPGNPALYICRAPYAGGLHPGKIVGTSCNFGYGGLEVLASTYEVLTHRRR